MKNLTGLFILLATVLFSSCLKDSNETDILNHVQPTPTEINESDLPQDAFDALQVMKSEMASEAAPDREVDEDYRNNCSFAYNSDYILHQNVCGFSNNSYGSIQTGNLFVFSAPVGAILPPSVMLKSETTPNEMLYYWVGVYDYAKGKYAYTKAGWGDIDAYYEFDFTPNKWHNSRIVVWQKDVSGQYGWRLVTGLWTMPFTFNP